jgi:nucleoside-diphosphate-sugar epimerase
MKKAIVCGAGGFIGGHMVRRLLDEGYKVLALDIKHRQDWYQVHEDAMNEGVFDLRDADKVNDVFRKAGVDEVYQFAADMGGAGYIFTGEHDADVMHNSATINLNVAHAVAAFSPKTKVFYSSSACIYPAHNQTDPNNPNCEESSAYPANPDSEYGWEKLFSERMWRSFARNYGLEVRIARFHNIFGPYGTWDGGKEKAPAAMCRKALQAGDGRLEVWGPGTQTRSFLYIDECVEAVRRLMESDVIDVINIGSDEMISINDLARMALDIIDADAEIVNIDGPVGVMGRCSDNELIEEKLGWRPSEPLLEGMKKTMRWIEKEFLATYNTP